MSAATIIHLITNIAFILLAGVAAVDYIRHRDWFRLDVLMMFGALAIIALSQVVTLATGWNAVWLTLLDDLLLLAQPYLLLRMVRHFRPVAMGVQWVAFGGMLLTWLAIVVFLPDIPLAVVLLLVAYFVYVESYAAVAFFQDARKTGGVVRRRLFLASFGSAMIGLVVLMAGINAAFPATTDPLFMVGQSLALIAAASYFLGFAPPRWLRRYWQYGELHHFLHRSSELRAEGQRYQYLQLLCQMAMQTVGGVGAGLALWSTDHDDLVVQQSVFSPSIRSQPDINAIDLKSYWRARQPVLVDLHPGGSNGIGIITAGDSPHSAFILPVATVERNWGVLLVYLWRAPVFTSDDLDLLRLYSEQAAISLTYEALLARQETLIGQLNQSQVQLQSVNEDLKQEILERQRAEKEREKAIREQAAREESESARARFAFLAEASHVLSSSLDERAALGSLARLIVPAIADGCEVDLIEPEFLIRAVEITHIDPEKARLHRQWREMHPIRTDSHIAVVEVIRSRKAQLFSDLTGANIDQFALTPEEREIFLRIGYRSSMVLPLNSRERLLGAMILFKTDSEHCFTPDDLSFCQDLANRAGLAIDNAILYTDAQRELAERVEIEQALRDSQERLLLTTEAADVGMWSTDLVTGERYWDAKFCELMGLDPGDVSPDLTIYDLMAAEDRPKIEAAVRQALAGHRAYEGEYRVTWPDGTVRWIFSKGKGVYDGEGKAVRLVGVALDITRRREIEARTRENLAQIEVHHRLMSQREQERRKIAQDLHDGPLQELIALTFLASSAIESTQDPATAEQLEAIRESLKERINELRAFASELRPPALERFGLDKAIDSHLDTFQKKYPDIQIRMEARTHNVLPPEAVGLALFRIYQESLNNIVRHAQATEVVVGVSAEDGRISLEIRDNGQGFKLPAQWLELAREGHLGLVGIHERAEALGGTARIYSNPGEGTIVKVEIPI
jgi:PAS domain S-box-containing protein